MDRYEAAQALGVADADLLTVAESVHGVEVEVRDGGRRLIRDDGIYAIGEHPGSAHLRQWPNITVARPKEKTPEKTPEPALAPADDGGVPSGTANEVLDWVGDDMERAAVALQAETAREHPRSVLVGKLRKAAER